MTIRIGVGEEQGVAVIDNIFPSEDVILTVPRPTISGLCTLTCGLNSPKVVCSVEV